MDLTEAQVARYSRHILLPEVGGAGQRRLLAASFEVHGAGLSASVAAAYLVAAGVRVVLHGPALGRSDPGFLFGRQEEGGERGLLGAAHLAALNPDVRRAEARWGGEDIGDTGVLATLPHAFEGRGPWVAIGSLGGAGVVAHRLAGGCAGCFARVVARLEPLDQPQEHRHGPRDVGLGALAALCAVRLILAPAASVATMDGVGWTAFPPGAALAGSSLPRCDAHA